MNFKQTALAIVTAFFAVTATAQTPALIEINPALGPVGGSGPDRLMVYNNKLYFSASGSSAQGSELWMVDGNNAPVMVADVYPGNNSGFNPSGYNAIYVFNNKLYFMGNKGAGNELFEYNGTGSPVLVKDFDNGPGNSQPQNMEMLDGKLYFTATEPTHGWELYQLDPASNTIQMIPELVPGTTGSNINYCTAFKGKLYFQAIGPKGNELYAYDPATNTTNLVADIDPVNSSMPSNFLVYNNKMYFTAVTATTGRELYTFDGDAGMPVKLTDVNPGVGYGVSETMQKVNLAVFDGKIFFDGQGGNGINELYSYDPLSGTTKKEATIGDKSGNITDFFYYAKKLFFMANDGTHGEELWAFDGTNATMVADILPGPGSSTPSWFKQYNGNLYFAANDSTHGIELFKFYDAATGIQNIRFDAELKLYPNPATSLVHLDITLKKEQSFALFVTDITGKKVFSKDLMEYKPGTHQINIPLNELPAGAYFYGLRDTDGGTLASGKFVRE